MVATSNEPKERETIVWAGAHCDGICSHASDRMQLSVTLL